MMVWLIRLGVVALLLGAWEFALHIGDVDPDLLPPPEKVLASARAILADPAFRLALAETASACLAAFAIVGPLGLVVGFALAERPALNRALGPALQLLTTTPKSIFLPAFILLLGIGFIEKVVFAIALTFFLVFPSGLAAARAAPAGLAMAARAFGATRAQIYWRVYAPAALPIVLDGLRLALIFSIHGVLFAEMYASSDGVGRIVLDWGESYRMTPLFAAVAIIIGATVALNEAFQLLETRWRARPSEARG